MIKKPVFKLNAEEKRLEREIARGEWVSAPNQAALRKRHAAYAHFTLEKIRKNRRVNIRLSIMDVEDMQRKALEEGIPYQTLMASVLHKYVTGRLVEKQPQEVHDDTNDSTRHVNWKKAKRVSFPNLKPTFRSTAGRKKPR
ncbi:MAG: hypothetical protein KGL74_10515 [Elusimicrobia bacterium]|nr:hypothetical protein [Elusimicrobiota bacterium]